MKTLNLNFKQLSTLLFVSIIVCVGNLFYSKNLDDNLYENEFVEREGIEDSIIISNTENNYLFYGIPNLIKLSNYNKKKIVLEGVDCSIMLDSLGNDVYIYPSQSSNGQCFLIFKDKFKKNEISRFVFDVKPMPTPKLHLGGVISGQKLSSKNSVDLEVKFPCYFVPVNTKCELISYSFSAKGIVIEGRGNTLSKECIDIINTLDKGQEICVVCKCLCTRPFWTSGVWEKDF